MIRWLLLGAAATVLLAGCAGRGAQQKQPTAQLPSNGGGLTFRMRRPEEVPENRRRPMALRDIDVAINCPIKGGIQRGIIKLMATRSNVTEFTARVEVPRHGICQADLTGFRQTSRQPQIELLARDGCAIHVWQQDGRTMISFAPGCRARCSGDAIDYVVPVAYDPVPGTCG